MFYMDCIQDGVCTLDLQPLTTAGWLGSSKAPGHPWDLEICRSTVVHCVLAG